MQFAKITQASAFNVKMSIDYLLDHVASGVSLPKVLNAEKVVKSVIMQETVQSVNQASFKTHQMPIPAPVVPSILLVLLKRLHTAYKNLTMPKELFLSSLNQI